MTELQNPVTNPPAPKKNIRGMFLTGLVILMPLLVTLWVVQFLFAQLNRTITPHVQKLIHFLELNNNHQTAWVDFFAPMISMILTIFGICLLGWLGGNVLGRQLLRLFERLVMQIPFIRGIYSNTRQFLETFSSSNQQAFRRVVLVEYPRKGLWTMGLLTNDTKGEVADNIPHSLVNVFIPTTPNPTSGWLLFVPIDTVIMLDMSVDDAFKMIISGGVLTPPPMKTIATP